MDHTDKMLNDIYINQKLALSRTKEEYLNTDLERIFSKILKLYKENTSKNSSIMLTFIDNLVNQIEKLKIVINDIAEKEKEEKEEKDNIISNTEK